MKKPPLPCAGRFFVYNDVMYYHQSIIIDRPIGNNAFVYDDRKQLLGKAEIIIPTIIDGSLGDIKVGSTIVFAEKMDGEVKEFVGLEKLVRIRKILEPGLPRRAAPRNDDVVIYIMDNHNHALYCWYKEYIV